MEPSRADAIVLRRREFSESSWLIDFITPEWGCLKTIAKGARRPESRLRGRLELFNRGRIIFYPSRRSDLHLLSQFDVTRFASAPGATLETAAYFYYLAELLLAVGFGSEAGRDLFEIFDRELGDASGLGRITPARIRFEIDFLKVLGVFPPLAVCGECQGDTSDRLYFSPVSRSWICSRCRSGRAGAIFIQEGVRALVNHILEGGRKTSRPAMSASQEKILDRLCRLLVDINVGKKIRSLSFLQQVKEVEGGRGRGGK